MFLGAQIVVINKIDLADAMGVSVEALTNDVRACQAGYQGVVCPRVARPAEGIDRVAESLLSI